MTALRIALRYLRARKSHNAVNVIAGIATGGVAVAVAAMVVVLSVFNGFAELAAKHLSVLDPPLLVVTADGRPIGNADSLAQAISKAEGVTAAVPTVMRKALIVADDTQVAIDIKGVAEGFEHRSRIDSCILDGVYAASNTAGTPSAQIAVGVANSLRMTPGAERYVTLYTPRRVGRISPANPAAAFRSAEVNVSGVFSVDQPDVDASTVLVPLEVARGLLDYDTEADAVEVFGPSQKAVSAAVGPKYRVLTRLEQRGEAFHMIAVEKWVTFMMLVFVLAIALFNIIATLSLLVIEKRDNMLTLRALGATHGFARRVFFYCGCFITAVGGLIGIALGTALSLAQQYGHFIRLGGNPDTLSINYYPVAVAPADLLLVAGVVGATAVISGSITLLMKK